MVRFVEVGPIAFAPRHDRNASHLRHEESIRRSIFSPADYYLGEPFRIAELLARLHAVLRRYSGHASAILSSGPVSIDSRRRAVMVDGMPLDVTPMECKCLSVLMQNRGQAARTGCTLIRSRSRTCSPLR